METFSASLTLCAGIHRCTKASDAEAGDLVEAGDLRRHRAHYDVTLMHSQSDINLAAEQQCKNITEDEAPRHGGMVCNWFNEQSSIFCGVRCNPGYEHPAKVNAFETCGPATNFEWSFRIKMNNPEANYPSCIGKS